MPQIEFRILGPLQLGHGHHMIIKSPRQQVVLAALLLNPNRPVPVDSLTNAVWEGTPPEGARHQLQNCAWMLRRRIRDLGMSGAEITASPAGYAIHVDECRLDVTLFERQLAESRRLAASGRLAQASQQIKAALSLWQGPPLSGVPGRVMRREAAGLAERRLSAQEDWIDLEMALGRGSQVTADLYRLVAEQPFRERLRAQLMIALHASGRTAEALATYRQARRLFVDELGLEPGPVLKGVERGILQGGAALRPAGLPYAFGT
ncbi:AfsR/SARP family transcriptional regulator [Nonomuraea sp. KM90]|uniref:AfsR/SARP family transcriptional regulator n=1 Tax=Nonomuraea sp. KM90 TaxID=3457428 RepID=UPI003FCD5BF2